MVLPEPSPSSTSRADRVKRLLEARLGPSKVLTEPATLEQYANDDSDAPGKMPDAVVVASTPEDIRRALAVALETHTPITPRAAGTGRSGGATTVQGGIVLSTLGMNNIVEVDREEGLAVVEPGVVLSHLQDTVEAEGWMFPPDPSSLSSCAIAGNVAENAAGPRAFKYGATGHYVLGMEAHLVGGQSLELGRRTKKGVTGYDVTSLLVGSEGTLAIFGKIVLRLIPKPEQVMTMMALFSTVTDATRAVTNIIARRLTPRCIELLDGPTLQILRDAGNPLNPGAEALLLIDVDGTENEVEQQATAVLDACEAASAIEGLVAQDSAQRDRLWSARREMSYAVRRLSKHKLSEDVVVPRRRLPELLDGVHRLSEAYDIRMPAYGHAGDGNMHVNLLWNDPEEKRRVDQATKALFELTIQLGGTLSGEHGIGVLKAPYLPLEQSPQLIDLQRQLKQVFDPKGLLNPGKIFPRLGHGPC